MFSFFLLDRNMWVRSAMQDDSFLVKTSNIRSTKWHGSFDPFSHVACRFLDLLHMKQGCVAEFTLSDANCPFNEYYQKVI